MSIELVVFDMAGTTVNDEDGVNLCLRAALEHVGVFASRDAVNAFMGIPKPLAIERLLEKHDRKDLLPKLEAIHDDFVRRMIHFYRTDPSVREIEGTSATFRRLRSAGIKVALDTGFSREIVEVLLERLGWRDDSLVQTSVTSDEVQRGRPHPDLVQKAMRDLGVSDAARVAKVGDTPSDLQEGDAAGCGMVIGVTGGSHTAEQLEPFPHTHLIATVAELPALLGL
ncbi:MAG: phosphonatase-like hydrolase [Planctomycetota bacterium]|nr:MAG: phosphonatase-like hydrolase [Planctomycetota bacterium]